MQSTNITGLAERQDNSTRHSMNKRPKKLRRRQIDYQVLVGYLLFSVGFMISFWLATSFYDVWRSQDWPATDGLIYDAQIVRRSTNPFDMDKGFYQVIVTYQYRVEQQRYRGTNIYAADLPLMNETHARTLKESYPISSVQSIYYDPKQPAESILDKSVSQSLWYLVVVNLFFLLIGLGIVRKHLRSR